MKQKQCKDCKELKNQSEFYGVQGECKNCTQKRVQDNYLRNIKHYKAYEVKRGKDPERKKKKAEYLINYRLRNRDKNIARMKLWRAVKSGKIKKEVCEVCKNTKTEAHHTDYSKPLLVNWLCLKHHRQADKKQLGKCL
jgi:TnpA family transposase